MASIVVEEELETSTAVGGEADLTEVVAVDGENT